jgi:hypothetical protein
MNPAEVKKQPETKVTKVAPATKAPEKRKIDIKGKLQKKLKIVAKYQAPIMAIIIAGLLTLTALRMLHYANPTPDDAKVKENLSKFKKINIDSKTVERIKKLSDSNSSTGANIEKNRTNPFSENP